MALSKQVSNFSFLEDDRDLEIKLKERTQGVVAFSEEEQASILAKKYGLPYLDLNIFPLNIEVLYVLPKELAERSKLVVIFKTGKKLKVAITEPENPETRGAIKTLQEDQGFECQLYLVSKSGFLHALEKYKFLNLGSSLDEMRLHLSGKDLEDFEKQIKELTDLKKRIREIPTTEVLNIIIAGAVKLGASDVHLEPGQENVRLRYRLDGVLQNISEIPYNVYPYILSRVKMMAGMKLNIKDKSQDGRFEIKLRDPLREIDVRVSILPGNFGENIVARLLNQNMEGVEIESLGLKGKSFEQLVKQIQKPNGMILNTGPTGSGKTTTLYACLQRVNTSSTKIITIEDPIEYRLKGISQTQVQKERGYDFANGLRAIVRQDPDVILVGEIRDEETADIAVHASLTGHLVFSTVHANSAAGAIPRLLDLGVRPSLIGAAINAVIAQRLVRKLCPYCREEYVPAKETLETINKFLSIISPKAELEIPKNIKTLYRSVGCSKCNGLGYKGRLGIFEIFEITQEIEKLINEMLPASDLMAAAMENGMITMLQDGILKAVSGETSMEEVQQATGSGDFLEEIYEKIMSQLLASQLVIKKEQIEQIKKAGFDANILKDFINTASNQEALEYVVGGALSFDAGDIHFEPEEENVSVRYRIDGILQNISYIENATYLQMLARIKSLSGFKASSHEAVRDSRFGIKLDGLFANLSENELDVRVSIITGGYGETVVLRLLHKSARSLEVKSIGIRPEVLDKLLFAVQKPNGLVLNTGPTGSGKTTTLYSLLNRLNRSEVKIITVEDPIEYRLKGILQTQVNEEQGYSFSNALRALLRQNPDIMMIGEIRDEETAKIAVQAALTGHLVLSTLHTNNAVASIQRLINMGVDPSDISSAINGLMAQRLVRKLCPHCKKAVTLDDLTKDKILTVLKAISKKVGVFIPSDVKEIFEPVGCNQCKGTGYNGVIPLTEVMLMSEQIEELIARFSTVSAITRQAIEEGMLSMAQDGMLRVVEGITSLSEVERVTEE